MNKFWRQLSAVGLLAIYCLATGMFCTQDYSHSKRKIQQNAGAETYSIVSNGLFGEAIQPIKSVNAGVSSAYSAFKNPFNEFSFLLSVDKLISSSFLQYQFFFTRVLLSAGKTDIIFPFQYFW